MELRDAVTAAARAGVQLARRLAFIVVGDDEGVKSEGQQRVRPSLGPSLRCVHPGFQAALSYIPVQAPRPRPTRFSLLAPRSSRSCAYCRPGGAKGRQGPQRQSTVMGGATWQSDLGEWVVR